MSKQKIQKHSGVEACIKKSLCGTRGGMAWMFDIVRVNGLHSSHRSKGYGTKREAMIEFKSWADCRTNNA